WDENAFFGMSTLALRLSSHANGVSRLHGRVSRSLWQEIVLGIGGVRALKALNIEPTVIHVNEGHSAFSALERINNLRREKKVSFDAARELVVSTTVFTTHTPVPAGNDVFEPGLIREYFKDYVKELGIMG
ncbi:MAG: glycogen/starch/alpha-glucan phosphorylase, partial [Deltaproteobacteria bacterium]|nr:glycogen/starch/alpha-glucan phosphorylase [Deltaproteobacteria bacterium]